MTGVLEKANRAKRAYLACVGLESRVKDKALNAIANALVASKKRILEANKLDLQAAAKAGLPDALIARLKLSGEKIDAMALGVRSVARLSDPVGRTLQSTELDKNLILYKVSTSIGVIGFIFESRPDVVAQIASLSLKYGNSVILKGGSEALHSNRVLCEVIEKASAEAGIPKGWIQLLESRRDVEEMLSMNGLIDLIIPRGSKQLVEHIQKNSRIPVLGHAEGICHAFVDRDADLKKAVKVCHDAKVQYPAVCNAIETLLVDGNIAKEFLPEIARDYEKAGVELRVDEKSRKILKDFNTKKAVEADWTTEYGDLIISIKVV